MNGMEIVLIQVVVFSFTGFTTLGVIKLITNYRLKKRMIDAGLVDEQSMEFLKDGSKEDHNSSLKWGLILFFIGIPLMLIESLDWYYDTAAAGGVIMTGASLGFIVYFIFMRREMKRKGE